MLVLETAAISYSSSKDLEMILTFTHGLPMLPEQLEI